MDNPWNKTPNSELLKVQSANKSCRFWGWPRQRHLQTELPWPVWGFLTVNIPEWRWTKFDAERSDLLNLKLALALSYFELHPTEMWLLKCVIWRWQPDDSLWCRSLFRVNLWTENSTTPTTPGIRSPKDWPKSDQNKTGLYMFFIAMNEDSMSCFFCSWAIMIRVRHLTLLYSVWWSFG